MQGLDFQQIDEKPIKLKLKSGQVFIGSIQMSTPTFGYKDVVPFLTVEKRRQMREYLGITDVHKTFVPLSDEEIHRFIEFIPIGQIERYEVIETQVGGLHLVSMNGVDLQIPHKFKVHLFGLDMPGLVKASFSIPGHDKLFEIGELAIKGGKIEIPVSVAFISYSREDEETVVKISQKLNDFAVVTWFDKRNLMPGDDWEMRIEQAIEQADFFLLFLSRLTEDKISFRNREIQLALKQQSYRPRGKRFIIPILLDDCTPPYDLRNLNWLKATNENWLENLVESIAPWYARNH